MTCCHPNRHRIHPWCQIPSRFPTFCFILEIPESDAVVNVSTSAQMAFVQPGTFSKNNFHCVADLEMGPNKLPLSALPLPESPPPPPPLPQNVSPLYPLPPPPIHLQSFKVKEIVGWLSPTSIFLPFLSHLMTFFIEKMEKPNPLVLSTKISSSGGQNLEKNVFFPTGKCKMFHIFWIRYILQKISSRTQAVASQVRSNTSHIFRYKSDMCFFRSITALRCNDIYYLILLSHGFEQYK